MSISIRPVLVNDATLMAGIAACAHSHPMSKATIESCFGNFYHSFGAYHNNQLVGFVILHQLFEEATIMDICINTEYQGQGYGNELLKFAIKFIQQSDAEVFMLEVRESNAAAINLYKKKGFLETGLRKDYYKTLTGTENAILMKLTF